MNHHEQYKEMISSHRGNTASVINWIILQGDDMEFNPWRPTFSSLRGSKNYEMVIRGSAINTGSKSG